jgi:hypothetical protein
MLSRQAYRSVPARRLLPAMQPLEERQLLSYDIFGVQPASLDQPRVNAVLRRAPEGNPLSGGASTIGFDTYNIQAFFGSSD